MLAQPVPEEDRAPALNPPIIATAPDDVRDVIPLPAYRLAVRFHDGVAGIVDMSALVKSPNAGVFAALSDPLRFTEAYVQYGAVTWPGEIDLAPDAMYKAIKAHGTWVLT